MSFIDKTFEKDIGDGCEILDYHTVKSSYIGEDKYGNKKFNTIYTELGNLIYNLKYGNDRNTVRKIVLLFKNDLERYKEKIDTISLFLN